MADSINAQGLTFNPAFLQAMEIPWSHLSDVAFANGEAGLHFALRPGTADGVMQTELVIDSQKLVYMTRCRSGGGSAGPLTPKRRAPV